MNPDGGDQIQRPARDIWTLPDILAVEARWRRFEEPRRLTVRGVDRSVEEGLEVVVRLSGPVPVRALGPVLWVGDVPLTVADSDGDAEYRFLAPDPEALESGAEISLSWNAANAPRTPSGHRLPRMLEELH